jgi:hypothetical protein
VIVRAVALFDLVVTAILAFPVSGRGFVDLVFRLNGYFGGVSTSPAFDSVHWLFVNLAGVLGVVWALARLVEPSRLLASLDAAGRVAVSILILWYVVLGSAPGMSLAAVVTELAGAVVQVCVARDPGRRTA